VGLLRGENGRRVFKDQVVSSVGEQLLAQVLRRVQVFTRRVLALALPLDGVKAGGDASVLDLDLRRRMGELALVLRATAFVPLELATNFQSQPARVLLGRQRQHGRHPVHQISHVYRV